MPSTVQSVQFQTLDPKVVLALEPIVLTYNSNNPRATQGYYTDIKPEKITLNSKKSIVIEDTGIVSNNTWYNINTWHDKNTSILVSVDTLNKATIMSSQERKLSEERMAELQVWITRIWITGEKSKNSNMHFDLNRIEILKICSC